MRMQLRTRAGMPVVNLHFTLGILEVLTSAYSKAKAHKNPCPPEFTEEQWADYTRQAYDFLQR